MAEHKLTLTKYHHKINIEFTQKSDNLTTITLKLNHWASKAYLKFIIRDLHRVFPEIKPVALKPLIFSSKGKSKDTIFQDFNITYQAVEPLATKSKFRSKSSESKSSEEEKTWICDNCGYENDESSGTCELCGALSGTTYSSSGATLEYDYGGDDLWDDDQGLM